MSYNDVEVTPKGNRLRYEAIIDECKVYIWINKYVHISENFI